MSATAPLSLPAPLPVQSDWALFLDVDGCLLDFADRPEDVRVPHELQDALARLETLLGGAIAFVSGRRVAQIDSLFAPLRIAAAGLHGLEVREEPDGPCTLRAPPDDLAGVREEARRVVERHPGAWLEDKDVSLALHWRAAPQARSSLEEVAESAIGRLEGYRLQHGNCVVELRPSGCDKGTAVRRLMQRAPFAGRVPVYAGDDFTDEDAFAAANALGGISVIVGDRRPTAARHCLHDTASLRHWLIEAAQRMESRA